jgi:hypothetical protein
VNAATIDELRQIEETEIRELVELMMLDEL